MPKIKDMKLDESKCPSFTENGVTAQFINNREIIVKRHVNPLRWEHTCSTAISKDDIFSFHVNMMSGEVDSLDRNGKHEFPLIDSAAD